MVSREVGCDPLAASEEKHFVPDDGPADGAAELLAVEIFEWLAIRRVRARRFQPLEVDGTPAYFFGACLGDDVDDAARRAPKHSGGAACHHPEFLHGLEQ